MRVQCVSAAPSAEQTKRLGHAYRPGKTQYPIQPGLEYLVLGLGVWDGVAWIEIAMETEVVVSVPLFLFDIVEASPSRTWVVRAHADGGVTLWPEAFYRESFHDRLSEGHPAEVAELRELQSLIRSEEG